MVVEIQVAMASVFGTHDGRHQIGDRCLTRRILSSTYLKFPAVIINLDSRIDRYIITT